MISLGELIGSDFEGTVLLEPKGHLNPAIVGVMQDSRTGDYRVVYDLDRLKKAFMDMNGWTNDEAQEWIDFNVVGAYMGPGTPIYMDPILDIPRRKCDAETSVSEDGGGGYRPPGVPVG